MQGAGWDGGDETGDFAAIGATCGLQNQSLYQASFLRLRAALRNGLYLGGLPGSRFLCCPTGMGLAFAVLGTSVALGVVLMTVGTPGL